MSVSNVWASDGEADKKQFEQSMILALQIIS